MVGFESYDFSMNKLTWLFNEQVEVIKLEDHVYWWQTGQLDSVLPGANCTKKENFKTFVLESGRGVYKYSGFLFFCFVFCCCCCLFFKSIHLFIKMHNPHKNPFGLDIASIYVVYLYISKVAPFVMLYFNSQTNIWAFY